MKGNPNPVDLSSLSPKRTYSGHRYNRVSLHSMRQLLMLAALIATLLIAFFAQTSYAEAQSTNNNPVLYLTFDDGPGVDTLRLLELLDRHDVQATFFATGANVANNPELARQVVEKGHVIANHTWSHPRLTLLADEEISDELHSTTKIVEDTTGVTPLCYRPPFGDVDERVHSLAVEAGLPNAEWTTRVHQNNFGLWDIDTNDWRFSLQDGSWTEEEMIEQLDAAVDGDTILLHDGPINRSRTNAILERWLIVNGDQFEFRALPGC